MEVATRRRWAGRMGPLYPFARSVYLGSIRVRAALESGAAALVRLVLFVLPIGVKAKLKHSFAPVARMDYDRHEIRLHVDSASSLYRTLSCRKEPETVRWIEEYVRPGEVLYDIGANVGAYSLVAAKHCGGNVQVFSFEPSFSTYYELCKNVILNGCEKTIFPQLICLTDAPGMVLFNYASVEAGAALHAGAGASGGPAVYQQKLLGFSIDVLVDQFGFPLPHHMKIDVDGIEASILRGAVGALRSGVVRSVQLESTPLGSEAERIQEFMAENGFRLLAEEARGGGQTWKNYLFVRDGDAGTGAGS
jgi:FkbM family methyltransferase